MQNIKETSDTLRGLKVNARKHWDGESWILEDAKTRKPLLIGTRSQILDEYDRRNKSFKTLQKPLEAILKPSKGFSLSATHPKSENAVKGQYADRLRSGNP